MLIISASLLFSFYFIHIAKIPAAIKTKLKFKAYHRLKPFDCFSCLSVWVAVIFYFLPNFVNLFILNIFGAGCIANFAAYILNRYK
jgi:hypothetical protein